MFRSCKGSEKRANSPRPAGLHQNPPALQPQKANKYKPSHPIALESVSTICIPEGGLFCPTLTPKVVESSDQTTNERDAVITDGYAAKQQASIDSSAFEQSCQAANAGQQASPCAQPPEASRLGLIFSCTLLAQEWRIAVATRLQRPCRGPGHTSRGRLGVIEFVPRASHIASTNLACDQKLLNCLSHLEG